MNPIYDYINKTNSGYKCLGITILLVSITVIISTLCAFLLRPLDKRRRRMLRVESSEELKPNQKITIRDIFSFPLEIWLIIIICIVFYSATFPFIVGFSLIYLKIFFFF